MLKPEDLTIEGWPELPATGLRLGHMPVGVRITHKPTGMSVAHALERGQHRNREVALSKLTELVEAANA